MPPNNNTVSWKIVVPAVGLLVAGGIAYGALQFQSNANADDIVEAEARMVKNLEEVEDDVKEQNKEVREIREQAIVTKILLQQIQTEQFVQGGLLKKVLEKLP